MPTAALSRCRQCGQLGCIQHKAPGRPTSVRRGYNYRWQQRSKAFLGRYPLCGMRPFEVAPVMSQCHDEHTPTAAVLVDHVTPHRGNDALFWDELGNWQSMCRDCHARKTAAGL